MASLLYGLAGKLAGELCSPLFKDYVGKPWELGTKAEFEKLKDTVSSIEAVILDAEEKGRTNNQVRDWLIKIKLVFYDVEDLLQDFRTEALKRKVVKTKNKKAKKVHIFFSCSSQLKYRFKMGRKVKLIRERLDAIASDRNSFNFTEWREEMHIVRRREETHSFVHIDQFIGRDADKECVTKHLLQSNAADNVSMVSILGIGGMGKTTLAQALYNSEEVKSIFDLRMWVCVSDTFDVKLICENIIESATKNKCERLQMDVVKDKLKNIIDGRKFLLVLDDVWNETSLEWMKLELLLKGGAKGSKILITARAELVARAAKSIPIHVLKGLSHEDSWALFKQVAFKRGVEQVSPIIEGIGKEVVKKCAGVPLVVKAIGSILALKEKEIDWLDFIKNDLPRVTRDCEGSVLPVLKLSYDYLSTPLKRCFGHCAVYPKDYLIKKEHLIGMWIAHGLIQLDGTTRSFEDVGERHFMDLLDRSFFEVYDIDDEDGIITFYKMHDLTHDLAQSVGSDEYYNPSSGANHINKSTRHAWISGDELTNICNAKRLSTLVLTKSCDKQQVTKLISTFEQLRVLRLADLELTRLPTKLVGGLKHLNYLDLSYNHFDSLPESLCSLCNLHTLILFRCEYLKELPVRTRELVSLRCLDVSGCYELSQMPRGLEELTCLQTLSTFVIGGSWDCAEVWELKSLVNLRGSLSVRNLRALKCVKFKRSASCILMGLKLIQHLRLSWKRGYEDLKEEEEEEELLLIESLKPHANLEKLTIEYYAGKKFPSWLDTVNIGACLPNIVHIQLNNCKALRHLPPLWLLPSLQRLDLRYMGGIEYLVDIWRWMDITYYLDEPLTLFPSLKELSLCNMWNLNGIVEPTAATRATINNNHYFPVLKKLEILNCPLFVADAKQFHSVRELRLFCVETLPAWIQYLPHLQTLKISSCQGMVSLPEWMDKVSSLQEVHLEYLDSLACIPGCLQRLTSLQRLLIEGCPKLVSRCEKETGADWYKIAHIPNIKVKLNISSYLHVLSGISRNEVI